MESSFNEPKEDVQQSKQIHERTITEITDDGCIIEKKIVEYPTEETIEIEELEEVDGKLMSVKRSIVGEKKEEPSKLDNEPDIEPISDESVVAKEDKLTLSSRLKDIVIIPGHRKVEFDEKTNTTTVTEKTTTGYQQTIITVTEDGNTVHTKVFYDPLPGEETCEEASTAKPTTKKIQTKSSTKNSHVEESVISGKRAEKAETDKDGQQEEEEEHIQSLQNQEHKFVKKVQSNSTMKTTYVSDLQIGPTELTSLTQRKTTSDGKEIEVGFTVPDGKTKTIRKVVRQPSEEIEIEEYEEPQTYEPGEVKVVTTTKLIPFVGEMEEAREDMIDNADTVVATQNNETIARVEQQENKSQIDVRSKIASKTTTMQHRSEVKYQVNVCSKVSETKTETKTETKQSTTQASRTSTEANQTYIKTENTKTGAYASTNIFTSKTNEMDAKSINQTLSGDSTAVSKDLDSQIAFETF